MSLGKSLGRGVGQTGAFIVQGAKNAATYTGQFGQDFASGVKEGYAERTAKLRDARAAVMKAREERVETPAPAAVTVNA